MSAELYVMFPVDLTDKGELILKRAMETVEVPTLKRFQPKDLPQIIPELAKNGYLNCDLLVRVMPEKKAPSMEEDQCACGYVSAKECICSDYTKQSEAEAKNKELAKVMERRDNEGYSG